MEDFKVQKSAGAKILESPYYNGPDRNNKDL